MLSETDELHCDALSGLGWDGNFGGFPNNTHVSISWGNITLVNITYALYCIIYSVSFDNLIPCHILIWHHQKQGKFKGNNTDSEKTRYVVIDFKASCEPL